MATCDSANRNIIQGTIVYNTGKKAAVERVSDKEPLRKLKNDP